MSSSSSCCIWRSSSSCWRLAFLRSFFFLLRDILAEAPPAPPAPSGPTATGPPRSSLGAVLTSDPGRRSPIFCHWVAS
uniref:Putative secreted protein n=1 Tax=Ixodes ricinus TaxID=34613 RepID=A0A6B0TUN5_IXORI